MRYAGPNSVGPHRRRRICGRAARRSTLAAHLRAGATPPAGSNPLISPTPPYGRTSTDLSRCATGLEFTVGTSISRIGRAAAQTNARTKASCSSPVAMRNRPWGPTTAVNQERAWRANADAWGSCDEAEPSLGCVASGTAITRRRYAAMTTIASRIAIGSGRMVRLARFVD